MYRVGTIRKVGGEDLLLRREAQLLETRERQEPHSRIKEIELDDPFTRSSTTIVLPLVESYYKERKKVTNELKQKNEPCQAEGRGNQ